MDKESKGRSPKTVTTKDSRPAESVELQVDSAIHVHTVDNLSVEAYSTLDVVDHLKIPRERLRDWQNRGFIQPSQKAEGQGTKALFSRLDLYGIALFKYLVVSCKFAREEAARYTKTWLGKARSRKDPGVALSDLICFERMATRGAEEKITLRSFSHQIMAEMKNSGAMKWDTLFIVNFGKIRKDVDSRLS